MRSLPGGYCVLHNLIRGKPLTLYKESENKREWLHVNDHCRAIDMILKNGKPGETYNIGSGVEKSVEEVSDAILAFMGKGAEEKTYVPSRPMHDKRYLLDSSKIKHELGWAPETAFDKGLADTIEWYKANEAWWRPLIDRRPLDEAAWR